MKGAKTVSAGKGRKLMGLKKKQAMAGYVFLAPVIIGLVWLFIPALIQAVQYSMSNIKMGQNGIQLEFIGLKHYNDILFVNTTAQYLVNSFRQAAVEIPVIIIFSFFIANLLNQKFIGKNIARTVFFLPVIAAAGVIGQLDAGDLMKTMYLAGGKLDLGLASGAVYNYESLKQMLLESNVNQTFVSIILGSVDGLYHIVTASGVQILIFLAGLQSISPSLYEAAQVEGSNGWVSFWKISFPLISPLIMVNVVYTMVDTFTSYDNVTMQYIRIFLYGNNNYAYATALSIVYILVIAVVLLIAYFILNRFIVYRDAD